MSITDELRQTNGHMTAPTLPCITLSSGYSIGLRRQPADIMPKAQAAAEAELADDKPPMPTQMLQTTGGEKAIDNPADPEYQAALRAWQERVNLKTTEKLLAIMERIALVFEVDQERLAELRATYDLLGITLPDDDRAAWLGYVLAPTQDDQAHLFMEVYGKGMPTEAQVMLQRHLFPRDPQGNAA